MQPGAQHLKGVNCMHASPESNSLNKHKFFQANEAQTTPGTRETHFHLNTDFTFTNRVSNERRVPGQKHVNIMLEHCSLTA